jgi:hypothetical protein
MNIFKTLASGSGRIYEPNISAFLGYLLNPKEDHGLGDAFLKKFLEPLFKNPDLKYMKDRNLSIRSNFEMEVVLEQAFKKSTGKKEIVDIVILCYEKESQQKMYLAEAIIEQKKKGQPRPKHIFLIENKINPESITKKQLKLQYAQTIAKLTEWGIKAPQKLVSVIYVTPKVSEAVDEYNNFTETDSKSHLYWKKDNRDDSNSDNNIYISKIIKNIINEDYPPIDAYCKYTLQAFLEFIDNDFQSSIKEELKEKKRESPRFDYEGEKYSRPELAKKITSDYIDKYEKENNKKITLDDLKSNLFHGKSCPIATIEDAIKADYRKDGTKIYDNYGYYPETKEIADAEIRFCTGYSDKDLQELLDRTVKLKLDDLRIKQDKLKTNL